MERKRETRREYRERKEKDYEEIKQAEKERE